MLHRKREKIHAYDLDVSYRMMVGECYAMRSNLDELCFVRTLSYKDDYYTFDTLFVANQPFEPFSELWDKAEEIPAEVFQQVIERYDNCIREILSMDFEKTPLRRRRDIDEYYYTINRKNGKAIFGRVIDEYRTEQITVYPSGYSFNSCICNTDYMPPKARYYSIDPMTFQKVQKMHDVLNSTLLTLINSYLGNE